MLLRTPCRVEVRWPATETTCQSPLTPAVARAPPDWTCGEGPPTTATPVKIAPARTMFISPPAARVAALRALLAWMKPRAPPSLGGASSPVIPAMRT